MYAEPSDTGERTMCDYHRAHVARAIGMIHREMVKEQR